jgi:hypothetical protein
LLSASVQVRSKGFALDAQVHQLLLELDMSYLDGTVHFLQVKDALRRKDKIPLQVASHFIKLCSANDYSTLRVDHALEVLDAELGPVEAFNHFLVLPGLLLVNVEVLALLEQHGGVGLGLLSILPLLRRLFWGHSEPLGTSLSLYAFYIME